MTPDEYVKHLGSLMANLLSLEFLLRQFLQSLPSARPLGIPYGKFIYDYPVGTVLPVSQITNYDTLGKLIDKYNREAPTLGGSQVDKSLVEIRDALAHGRASQAEPGDNMRLVKFSRPKGNTVRVVLNEQLTAAWFTGQIRRVYSAIQAVQQMMNQVQPGACKLIPPDDTTVS